MLSKKIKNCNFNNSSFKTKYNIIKIKNKFSIITKISWKIIIKKKYQI